MEGYLHRRAFLPVYNMIHQVAIINSVLCIQLFLMNNVKVFLHNELTLVPSEKELHYLVLSGDRESYTNCTK